MNNNDFQEIHKEFIGIIKEFSKITDPTLDISIENVYLSLTSKNKDISNNDIKYILVLKNKDCIKIHKNIKEELNIFEEHAKIDFFFLKTRFNQLSIAKRELFFLLSEQFLKWDKKEQTLITFIINHFCETPKRTHKLFETIYLNKCNSCLKISNIIKKCIHFDCKGLCEDCFKDITEICPSCKQKQEIPCPICKESWEKKACHILPCGHAICWKCHYQSWKVMGKDIEKCPQCREIILPFI